MPKPSKNPFDQFMDECERFSAPFKLILRLIRASKKNQFQPSSESPAVRRRRNLWRKILGWEGFSFVFFTAVALTLLQLPHQHSKARWCFVLAAIALVFKVVYSVEAKGYSRLVIAVLAASLAGLGCNWVNDWVSEIEHEQIVQEAQQEITNIARGYVKPRTAPSPIPTQRSYAIFDMPTFPIGRDDKGQLTPPRDFKIGDGIFFNVPFRQSGPDPLDILAFACSVYIETAFDVDSQRRVLKRFKQEIAINPNFSGFHGAEKSKPNVVTLMPGQSRFSSPTVLNDKNEERKITQDDLNALHTGTEIAFVIAQITYQDNKQVHHARQCVWLQPPALAPGVWHSCIGDFNHAD